jgi:hypothetical protein
MEKAKAIDAPYVPLRAASVGDYCEAVRKSPRTSFWWYFLEGRLFRFSRPFRIADGSWWYQVKPGLCWPADVLTRRTREVGGIPYRKSFLGFQYLTEEPLKNSVQMINVITDLSKYSADCVDAKRRNAVRKGLRECTVEALTTVDDRTAAECCAVWEDFTQRTGWKRPVSRRYLRETWAELLETPGSTVLVGAQRSTGRPAGFLITKLIGDTAFVDTIAARTDMLHTNVNDALMYCFLSSAQRTPGIRKAHYAIKSYDAHLEDFKRSIGFTPVAFPARTSLRPGVMEALRAFFPRAYSRMTGAI